MYMIKPVLQMWTFSDQSAFKVLISPEIVVGLLWTRQWKFCSAKMHRSYFNYVKLKVLIPIPLLYMFSRLIACPRLWLCTCIAHKDNWSYWVWHQLVNAFDVPSTPVLLYGVNNNVSLWMQELILSFTLFLQLDTLMNCDTSSAQLLFLYVPKKIIQ